MTDQTQRTAQRRLVDSDGLREISMVDEGANEQVAVYKSKGLMTDTVEINMPQTDVTKAKRVTDARAREFGTLLGEYSALGSRLATLASDMGITIGEPEPEPTKEPASEEVTKSNEQPANTEPEPEPKKAAVEKAKHDDGKGNEPQKDEPKHDNGSPSVDVAKALIDDVVSKIRTEVVDPMIQKHETEIKKAREQLDATRAELKDAQDKLADAQRQHVEKSLNDTNLTSRLDKLATEVAEIQKSLKTAIAPAKTPGEGIRSTGKADRNDDVWSKPMNPG